MVKKKYARLAAALAALIITGAGWMPAQAANSDYGTGNQVTGDLNNIWGDNNTIYGDSNYFGDNSDNNYTKGDNNHIEGSNNFIIAEGSYLSSTDHSLYVGNGNGTGSNQNMSHVQDSAAFGDSIYIHGTADQSTTDTLVVGNNVTLNSTDKSLILGDNNYVGKADNTIVIGDRVEILSGKEGDERLDSTTVIGNDVHIGSQEHPASAAGDNITVIGDHVNVDNTGNRTNSSNSLIYGNNVTMTNSQNSVAMGNTITMTGTNDKGDNVAIGSGISLGQEGGGHATGTVAIGDQVKVSGTDNVVIGSDIDLDQQPHDKVVVLGAGADTDGSQSVSIGEGSFSGMSGTAVGGESKATGNAAAFGFQAVANAAETTVIGPYSTVNSSYSAALGDSVRIGEDSEGSVSIGGHSEVGDNAKYAIAIGGSGGGHDDEDQWTEERTTIGNGATASIAMGYGASIAENTGDSIALGTGASVNAPVTTTNDSARGIAIGYDASVTGKYSTAIGDGALAAGQSAIAIGDGAKTTITGTNGLGSIAMGLDSTVNVSHGVAIGSNSTVGNSANGGIALGEYATIGEGSGYAIAIGAAGVQAGNKPPKQPTEIGENADYSIAMGYGTSISDNSGYSLAMGMQSTVSSQQSVAMGYMSSIDSNSNFSIALGGRQAKVSGEYGTALGGYSAIVNATGGTALGSYTQVDSNYSVAVGYGSKATTDDIFTADELEAFKAQLGKDYDATYNITEADSAYRGVFSVGSADGARRIINVARGRISADSTDAVNGSQLYGAVKYLEGKIDAAGGGGDVSIDGDDNITVTDTTPTTPGTGSEGGTTVPGGETGGGTTEPGGGSTGGAGSGSEGQNFTVNMSDNPVFGGHDKDDYGHSPDGSVIVTGSNGANYVAINENNEGGMTVTSGGHTVNINKGGDGLVNGLVNTEWDWGKYEAGGYEGSTNAATESQLHELVGGIEQDITNMGDQITNLGGEVNRLSGRIDEVGAGAAALAALHPLDFDPDEKWDFAAGYGHYRGENAVAIGAFYRPNEDTMFSIGGTVGNGDEMINAGVSFKIGQGNHVSTSRVAMAKEIIELRKDLEDLRSAMAGGVTGQTLDLSKIQLFPDTPDNHWAYDYVATLAGNGILEGYPDGYFNGDRPITRYEMAAVLYRAMQKGVRLSDRALREFAPELDRIRVDTITKDEQGMPEIQRVRVVKGRE